jgi:hypothetical protein
MPQYRLPKIFELDMQLTPTWDQLSLHSDFVFSVPVVVEQFVNLNDDMLRYIFVRYDIVTHVHFSPSIRAEKPFVETTLGRGGFRLRITSGLKDVTNPYPTYATDEQMLELSNTLVDIQDSLYKLEIDHLRELRTYVSEYMVYNIEQMHEVYGRYLASSPSDEQVIMMNVFNKMFNKTGELA